MVKKNLALAFVGALLASNASVHAETAPAVAVKHPGDDAHQASITKAVVLTGLVYAYYAYGEEKLTNYFSDESQNKSQNAVKKVLEILLIKAAANELSDVAKVFYNKYIKGIVEAPGSFLGL